jgi:putative membrane protein
MAVEKKNDLSLDPRVQFAAERTLLAWIRTGLSMMGFGFVVARFTLFLKELTQVSKNLNLVPTQNQNTSLWVGTALIVLGVLVNFNAAREHQKWTKENPSSQKTNQRFVGVWAAYILGGIGLFMAFRLVELT